MRLVALERNDQAFQLVGGLVGIAQRPAAAGVEGLEPVLPIALEDLIAGLARDAELPTHLGHRLAIQEPSDETKALFHYRTRFPRHRHLPPESGKCHPCVRYEMSPMSRAAQTRHERLALSAAAKAARAESCPIGSLP